MTALGGLHAVITGGGTGIGAEIARALAGQGAVLTLVGRRRAALDAVAAEIERACVAPADVTVRAEVDLAFATARAAHGPIAILINNAGAADSGPFGRVTEDDWRRIMAVNLDALFHCCQAALPDLKQAPAGRIVTIASTAGLRGYAYTAAYSAAKHGAVGLTRALALELAGTNVTVNAVCPGFTDTAIVAEAVEDRQCDWAACGRGDQGIDTVQPAASADPATRGRRCRRLAVPVGQRLGHRPSDFDIGR